MIFGLKFTPPWKKTLGDGKVACNQGDKEVHVDPVRDSYASYRKSDDFKALLCFYVECIEASESNKYIPTEELKEWYKGVLEGQLSSETLWKPLSINAKAFLITMQAADCSSHNSLRAPNNTDYIPRSYRATEDLLSESLVLVCEHSANPETKYVSVAAPVRPNESVIPMTYSCIGNGEEVCAKINRLHPHLTILYVKSKALTDFSVAHIESMKKRDVLKNRVWRAIDGNFYQWIGEVKTKSLGTHTTFLVQGTFYSNYEHLLNIDDSSNKVILANSALETKLNHLMRIGEKEKVSRHPYTGYSLLMINSQSGTIKRTYYEGETLRFIDGAEVEDIGVKWFVHDKIRDRYTLDDIIESELQLTPSQQKALAKIDDGFARSVSSLPIDRLEQAIKMTRASDGERIAVATTKVDAAIKEYLYSRIREGDEEGYSVIEQLDNYLPKGDLHERESSDSME
ncbi:hypothetical protein [Vibrio phage BONAISHI]|nr:hypothetical protein [Vibrio phage BONAISHI]